MQFHYRRLGRFLKIPARGRTIVWMIGFWMIGLLSSLFIAMIPAHSQPALLNSTLAQTQSDQQLIEQARTAYEMGQIGEAIDLWQQALEQDVIQSDPIQQARVLTYLALAYHRLGEWTEATQAITTAFDRLSNLAESAEQRTVLAQALNARGYLEYSQGKPEVALATWQQTTELYQQLDDEVGIQGSLINQAQALDVLGFHRRSCQTILDALALDRTCDVQTLQEIEPILQSFAAQPDRRIQWLGLHSLGNTLRSIGNLSQSEQILQRSLTLAQELNSPLEIGSTLLSLGNTRRTLFNQAVDLYDRTQLDGDRQQVMTQAQQASETYQAATDTVASHPFSATLNLQVRVQQLELFLDWQQWLVEHEQPDSNNLEEGVSIASLQTQLQTLVSQLLELQQANLPSNRASVYAQIEFARLIPRLEDRALVDQAFQVAEAALQQAISLQDHQAQSYAEGTLGQLYEWLATSQQQTVWQEAQTWTESALMLAQSIQAWEITQQWQWQLGRIHRAKGEKEKAIAYYQAAVETLNTVRRDLVASNVDVQFSFRDTIEPVYRELVQLLLQGEIASAPSQPVLRQVIQQIDALRLSELENFLRCNLAQSVEISQENVDPTAAILYPIILKEQLAVILKLPQSESLLLHSVEISNQTVEQTLEQLRTELEKPYQSPQGLALSKQVYEWLIQPIATQLQENQIKTLVFVLDGELRNIPMAALHNGQNYLIEEYAIAVSPSLELLQPQSLAQLQLRVLSFGLSETRPNFPPHNGFAPLTNVTTELETIQAEIPGRTLLNQAFTRSTLEELVNTVPFPVIHLATHGQFSSNPEETFILAWDQRIDINDLSRILQSREQTTGTPIQLLVLSACKTADGDRRASLGLAGVAIQSGARSTIASLWYVNDQATAALMGSFYQNLANQHTSLTKAEALRQAQLALLHTEGYQAPLYWAACILVGNWL